VQQEYRQIYSEGGATPNLGDAGEVAQNLWRRRIITKFMVQEE
jgi:hypothetical protein